MTYTFNVQICYMTRKFKSSGAEVEGDKNPTKGLGHQLQKSVDSSFYLDKMFY